MKKLLPALVCLTMATAATSAGAAADTWSEWKSPHFTIWSNANDGQTRSLAWQLEQIRSALVALYPWAKVDLSKPLLIFAVKDENSVRALAPEYWEQRGGVRPVSVWVSGADQHYMVIRADVRGDDRAAVNPHTSSYFSYVNLILQSSFERPLPVWFSRGLAGVLSNTVVRDDFILLGPPIPWHLETLQEGKRLSVKQLTAVTRDGPLLRQDIGLQRFDAQTWALMHFLMFGDGGTHAAKVNRYATSINTGKDADAAFVEAFGAAEQYEARFVNYINRTLFSYHKVKADADVKREKFVSRPLAAADAAAGRALFHVAMRRPLEANAQIAEARQSDPNSAGAQVAEALQLDIAGKREDAKIAYGKAVDLGTTNPYALYRSAVLQWPNPDDATLKRMEAHLAKAVELSPNFALAHSSLAEVKVALNQSWTSILPLLTRAITLEPSSPWPRMAAARALRRFGNAEEALKMARSALALAEGEHERREAERLLAAITK